MNPRTKAIVLALFLGGLGAHHFFLNRPWRGVFHLLFCWTFIPSLIGGLEAIEFLLMSDATFERRVLRGETGPTLAQRLQSIRWQDVAGWAVGEGLIGGWGPRRGR